MGETVRTHDPPGEGVPAAQGPGYHAVPLESNGEFVGMPVSRSVEAALSGASWIRRMFEEGNRLRALHGPASVFDFTLGNPDLDPPPRLLERLRELTQGPPHGLHRYMPNSGWPEVRQKVAAHLERRTGLAYRAEHVVMTVGAGGALNVILKALLNPGDTVLVLAPYFVEYTFYVANHQGQTVSVPTDRTFGPVASHIAEAITERTAAIILNSPNNPSGRVYSATELEQVASVLVDAGRRLGRPIYLITDEPYRKIIYPGFECPEIPPFYDHTVLVTSSSKDLGLAGERIGYLAVSPRAADAERLFEAATFCNRTLGFVNAPSLFQHAVADCLDLSVDVQRYLERRELLLGHLQGLGFDIVPPGGAFYLFPRTPIADDAQFVRELIEERLLVVPGSGFGCPGHFRVSYAVPMDAIERSLPAWNRLADRFPQLASRR